ncbi:unnamed protein product [Hyaloperonospora brassicae]|uniref:RxLR effector protein n=1 Tax=Hyaloperonospora brassicae TaxID=162125 RepID=A0AAV0USS8_HYABA|nr:unnamed protein product [Hyaloperonospora brassicae]
MRPSLLVSAAVLCLATYDSAVAAASTSNNLLKSGETSSVLADHDAVAADTDPKHQRLLRHLEAEDPEIPASEPAVMASNVTDASPSNYLPSRKSNTAVDNSDTMDSFDSSDFSRKKRGTFEGYAAAFGDYAYGKTYAKWMHTDKLTRAQTKAKLYDSGPFSIASNPLETIKRTGYIGYLDKECALPENNGQPACA